MMPLPTPRRLGERRFPRPRPVAAFVVLAACTLVPDRRPRCEPPERTGVLPSEIPESSGVAVSREHPGVLWTHNDSGYGPYLFAIDSTGALLGRLTVTDAPNRDWEDLELAACPEGECLYIGDIGDNSESRSWVAVYVLPEPEPGAAQTAPARRYRMRYPDAPQDAEALFVLPGEEIFIITKGRSRRPALYRYPPPLREDEVVELEHIQDMADDAVWIPNQITGAAATRDGHWVLVRSYTRLQFYRPGRDGRLEATLGARGIDLTPAAEPQGEGVDMRDDGTVFLTSEQGPLDRDATVAMLRCELP